MAVHIDQGCNRGEWLAERRGDLNFLKTNFRGNNCPKRQSLGTKGTKKFLNDISRIFLNLLERFTEYCFWNCNKKTNLEELVRNFDGPKRPINGNPKCQKGQTSSHPCYCKPNIDIFSMNPLSPQYCAIRKDLVNGALNWRSRTEHKMRKVKEEGVIGDFWK